MSGYGGECHILFSVIGWSADALEAHSVMEEVDYLIMEGKRGRDRERKREVRGGENLGFSKEVIK